MNNTERLTLKSEVKFPAAFLKVKDNSIIYIFSHLIILFPVESCLQRCHCRCLLDL